MKKLIFEEKSELLEKIEKGISQVDVRILMHWVAALNELKYIQDVDEDDTHMTHDELTKEEDRLHNELRDLFEQFVETRFYDLEPGAQFVYENFIYVKMREVYSKKRIPTSFNTLRLNDGVPYFFNEEETVQPITMKNEV